MRCAWDCVLCELCGLGAYYRQYRLSLKTSTACKSKMKEQQNRCTKAAAYRLKTYATKFACKKIKCIYQGQTEKLQACNIILTSELN